MKNELAKQIKMIKNNRPQLSVLGAHPVKSESRMKMIAKKMWTWLLTPRAREDFDFEAWKRLECRNEISHERRYPTNLGGRF